MVSEDDEVEQTFLGLVDSQWLSIVGAIFLLDQVQLIGEESKGLP
jgi:hypothetical protein